MNVAYPNLSAEIARRGVKKSVIASRLGISTRTLHNKLTGVVSFKWEEANTICKSFFPDMSVGYLFEAGDRSA